MLSTMPDPRRSLLADKLFAKRYVAKVAPWIKTAQVFTDAVDERELDLASLPEVAVFKTNNSSGQWKVLQAPYDGAEIAGIARTWRGVTRPGWVRRIEGHYDAIERRFFFEEFLGSDPNVRVGTYRFHVIHGRVVYVQFSVTGSDGTRYRLMLDRAWNAMPISRYDGRTREYFVTQAEHVPPKPVLFDDMLKAAETLVPSMPFVRVDLYVERGEVWFGEFTFVPMASFTRVRRDWDLWIGEHLDLTRARKEIAEHTPITP